MTFCSVNCLIFVVGSACLALLLFAAFCFLLKEFISRKRVFPDDKISEHIEKEIQARVTTPRRVRFSEEEKKATIDTILPYQSYSSNKAKLISLNTKRLFEILHSLRNSFELSEKNSIILKLENLWLSMIKYDDKTCFDNFGVARVLTDIPNEDQPWMSINSVLKLLFGSWEIFCQSFKNMDSTGLMNPEVFFPLINKNNVSDEEKAQFWIQLTIEFHDAFSPVETPVIEYVAIEKGHTEDIHTACMWLRLMRALIVVSLNNGRDIFDLQSSLFNQSPYPEVLLNPLTAYLKQTLDKLDYHETNHPLNRGSFYPDYNLVSLFEIEEMLNRYGVAWKSLCEHFFTNERFKELIWNVI